MAEKVTKMKLDDYMVVKKMTKEQVFQAISRKEISGSFLAGEWMIFDDEMNFSAGLEAGKENDDRSDSRLVREKEEAIAKIAMAQTMAKTAQTEARNSADIKHNFTVKDGSEPRGKIAFSAREGRKSEVLKSPTPDAPDIELKASRAFICSKVLAKLPPATYLESLVLCCSVLTAIHSATLPC